MLPWSEHCVQLLPVLSTSRRARFTEVPLLKSFIYTGCNGFGWSHRVSWAWRSLGTVNFNSGCWKVPEVRLCVVTSLDLKLDLEASVHHDLTFAHPQVRVSLCKGMMWPLIVTTPLSKAFVTSIVPCLPFFLTEYMDFSPANTVFRIFFSTSTHLMWGKEIIV